MDTIIAQRLNEKHAERKLALGDFLQLKAKILNEQRLAKDALEIQDLSNKAIA
jgi:hypothetical protein|tara:strand:- start:338 stop:496 length:159 start_codon:yes stop_codon:yes gene_type:complete